MDHQRQEILGDLLLKWEDLYTRGQDTPAVELAREYPELAAELAERIKALKATAWFDEPPPEDDPADVVPGTAKPRTLARRYRLDELIALGGFAEVWRAYDQKLQRAVAIKIPKATRVDSADSFMAEARRVARLRHSGIVPVHDVGLDGDRVFIVAEFMDGGSLADRLSKGRVDQQQVIGWIARIADALDYAHINGVIHRDVKPANILINHHDEALLGDFGIAQSAHKTGTFDPSIGTLRYMAPEQLEGRPITPVSDVYSLAVVLHESLTGRIPFSSDIPNVIRQEITRGISKQVSQQLPDAVADVCRKALSRNPQERHSSAAHFAADLRKAVAAPLVPPKRTWWPIALAVITCLSVSGIWFGTQRDIPRAKEVPPATAHVQPPTAVESRIEIPDVKPITDAVQDMTGPQGIAADIKRMTSAIVRQHDGPPKDLVFVEGGDLPDDSELAGTAVSPFMISPVETTWGEWKKVLEFGKTKGYRWATKGSGSASDHPVHSVSWFDALKWCNARSEMEGLTPVYLFGGGPYRADDNMPTIDPQANGYRLPTEAEWEWAARGGKVSRGYEYSGSDDLNDVGWYDGNSMDAAVKLANIRGTWPVGQKQSNELGLYDMSGNVMEWCWDTDDSPHIRGGGWHFYSSPACRVADRSINRKPTTVDIFIGFRVARNAPQP